MARALRIHPERSYLAGTDDERARDLMDAFLDPEVDAVWAGIGGLNSNRILDRLDYAEIARHPKPLIGYSDITVLLNSVAFASRLVTFHGPNLVVEWGQAGGPDPFTERAFWQILSGVKAPIPLPMSRTTRLEPWPPGPATHLGMRSWVASRNGIAEGRLVGGNLRSFLRLAGTPWWPDLAGAVLFWEEVGLSEHSVDAMLVQLRTLGAFEQIGAMVIGKVVDEDEQDLMDPSALIDLVADVAGRVLPIVANVDAGHTDPMLTLPIGSTLRVDSERAELTLTEPAVREPTEPDLARGDTARAVTEKTPG
jgi:muramoyltetrapeptide carboxypeptidase